MREMCGAQLTDREIHGESNVWGTAHRQERQGDPW